MQVSFIKLCDILIDLKLDEIKCFELFLIFFEQKKEYSYDNICRKEFILIFLVDVDFYGLFSVDGGSEEVRI